MISKVLIENFRSIEKLEFEPKNLCALIGPNSVGKTNILKAINKLLGEVYPTQNVFTKDDFFNRDTNRTIKIQVWFKEPIEGQKLTSVSTRQKTFCNNPISFVLTNTQKEDEFFSHQFKVIDQSGNEFWGDGTIREKLSFIYIPSERDLDKQMSISQWTLIGKMLKVIDENFRKKDPGQDMSEIEKEFRQSMIAPKEILEKDFSDNLTYKKFKDEFLATAKDHAQGLAEEFSVDLEIYDPLFYYKTIQILGKEQGGIFNLTELGSGVQNLVLLSLFRTYAKLMKHRAVLAIEEPEIYLYPQAQRHLYKHFRNLSATSQIFYTTHSPSFVDAPNYDEICMIKKSDGKTIYVPKEFDLAQNEREEIKILTEFNTERNELFFADRVILVEGQTEKQSIPFILEKLGKSCERENIAIIECGGKEGLPYYIKICRALKLNWCCIYDWDRVEDDTDEIKSGKRVTGINVQIRDIAGDQSDRLICLNPDFQSVSRLQKNGRKWKEIRDARAKYMNIAKDDIPSDLAKIVEILYPKTRQEELELTEAEDISF